MEFKVTISKRGSFTIPLEIRKKLGLRPGQKVFHRMKNGKIVMEFETADAMKVRQLRDNK